MSEPFIRDGRLVGSPFAGITYDLTKLSFDQGVQTKAILDKAKAGYCLSMEDIQHLMKARKAARIPSANKYDRLLDLAKQLKEVLR